MSTYGKSITLLCCLVLLLAAAIGAYSLAIAFISSAHYDRGIVLAEQGKLDEAIAAYREAIAIDAGNADAHVNLYRAVNAARPGSRRAGLVGGQASVHDQ